MTSRTCSLTDKWLVTVTPSILIAVVRAISSRIGGRSVWIWPWAAPQVLNRVCLFPLPPLPFLPLPFPTLPPPSFPHSPPFPSQVEGSQSHLPLPSLSLPLPLPPGVPPRKPARGSGERYKLPPVGSGAKPQPTNDLVHIWAKRSSSGGNSFCAFHKNKCNFLRL